ncbi:unnamed protein product [Cunninghamella echinulata]
MMATTVRAAAKQLDWAKLSSSLPQETVASLQAFRKRNEEVKRVLSELKAQTTTVDFAHYKCFEKQNSKAQYFNTGVEKAKNTVQQIEAELKDFNATLGNIQGSRPIEQLTVDDIIAAKPELVKNVETMVEKGQFSVPGYKEKFGDISYF